MPADDNIFHLPCEYVEIYEISNVRSHYVLCLKEKIVFLFRIWTFFSMGLNEFMQKVDIKYVTPVVLNT